MAVRVAVVGAGVMGRHHANNYAALPGAQLVALVDSHEASRVEIETIYGLPCYNSLDALLANEQIDAVSVAAPTSHHYDLAKKLLEAGVHVLVEKPVATDVRQARSLIKLSQARGLVLQVGHITRFYGAVQLLQHDVRSPYLIEARRLSPHARIQDVGVILDLMIHDIDIVLSLVSARPKHISVAGHSLSDSAFEDVAAAQIVFENGCIARLLASRVAPDAERTLVVSERHQTHRLDFARDPHTEVKVFRPVGGLGAKHVQVDMHSIDEENPLRRELEHFLLRIRNDAEPIGTPEDDLRALSLATELMHRLEFSQKPESVLE